MKDLYKRSYFAGLIVYVILIIYAILFYKERIAFADASFTMFRMGCSNNFAVQEWRFGACLTQVLPLFAIKGGFALKIVALAYSFNIAIYYLTCYWICGSVLKKYELALILLLFNIMFVTDTFYWIPSELPQGVAFMVVFFAFISGEKKSTSHLLKWILIILSIFTIVFFHPQAIFVFVYFIAFFYVDNKQVIAKRTLLVCFFCYVAIYVFKWLVIRSKYDFHSLGSARHFVTLFPHYLNLYSNKKFLSNSLTKYYWVPILTFLISIFYIIKKEWRKLCLFFFASVGYLLFVNISFPNSTTPEFYIESLYLPLGIFIGVPLLFDLMPILSFKGIAVPLLVLIMLSGCIRIYCYHQSYSARLYWEKNFMAANETKKLLIDTSKVPMDTLKIVWGTSYEFWLLSMITYNKTASIAINDNPPSLYWALGNSKSLLGNWGGYPYSTLPQKYFCFEDTTSDYTVIK